MGVGGFNRNRLRSNASDASSTDDLDSSFNSGISPAGVSTTIFNYSTLKEQLNSPAKRSQATTKWCQNSAAVTAQENNMAAAKLRSSSASNIVALDPPTLPNANTSTTKFPDRARKAVLSRSRSIEVIVENTMVKRNSIDNETVDRISLGSGGRFAKSCDRLDYDHNQVTSSFFLNDDDLGDTNRTVNILNVTLRKRSGSDTISVVRLDENVKAKIEKQRSVCFAGTPPTDSPPLSSSKRTNLSQQSTNHIRTRSAEDTILNRANSQGNTFLNRSISEDNTRCTRTNAYDNTPFNRSISEDNTTTTTTSFNDTNSRHHRLNGDVFNSPIHQENPRNSTNLNNFSINEEDETSNDQQHNDNNKVNDSIASSSLFNTSHENSLSASLSNEANTSGFTSETSTVFGDNSTNDEGGQRSMHDSSILEDIAERDDADDVMPMTSASLDSVTSHLVLGSSVTISLDDSYLDEEEGRRDTLDSQGTIGSSHDGKSGMFSLDRSVTTDSMNSIATSDASHQSPDDGDSSISSSSRSHGVVHSHSDETIAKRSGEMVDGIALPPKSASLSEKKSGISPYFRRKKSKDKEAAKKEKQDRKMRARSMADALSDEPVLVSIKETGDGRMIFDDCDESRSGGFVDTTKKGVVETASIPIPVPIPAHVAKKSSPSATPVSSATDSIPKRKRSLYLRDVFKKVTVRRANSEQSLLDAIPSSPTTHVPAGMKPAFSSIEINNGFTAMSNGHALPLKSSPRNMNTNNNNPDFDLGTQSLERSSKKNTSLRERLGLFTQFSSSEIDIHKASSSGAGMDGKSSLKKDKKKLKAGSLRILNATPKESSAATALANGLDRPSRKTSMIQPARPQYVTRKSISINRGPLKIMSIFKHWLAKHPKVEMFLFFFK